MDIDDKVKKFNFINKGLHEERGYAVIVLTVRFCKTNDAQISDRSVINFKK